MFLKTDKTKATPLLVKIGVALAIALWNMKRWAALGLLVVTVFFLVLKVGAATHPALIIAIRLLPLAPAAIYWRRLTWT